MLNDVLAMMYWSLNVFFKKYVYPQKFTRIWNRRADIFYMVLWPSPAGRQTILEQYNRSQEERFESAAMHI